MKTNGNNIRQRRGFLHAGAVTKVFSGDIGKLDRDKILGSPDVDGLAVSQFDLEKMKGFACLGVLDWVLVGHHVANKVRIAHTIEHAGAAGTNFQSVIANLESRRFNVRAVVPSLGPEMDGHAQSMSKAGCVQQDQVALQSKKKRNVGMRSLLEGMQSAGQERNHNVARLTAPMKSNHSLDQVRKCGSPMAPPCLGSVSHVPAVQCTSTREIE